MEAALGRSLAATGAVGVDADEPSLAVLGRFARETVFKQIYRRLAFMKNRWNVPVEEEVAASLPLIEEHPCKPYIQSLALPGDGNKAASEDLIRPLTVVDYEFKHRPVMNSRIGVMSGGVNLGFESWGLAYRHADHVVGDYVAFRGHFSKKHAVYFTEKLMACDPRNPGGMAALVANDWASAEPRLAAWEKEQGDHPLLMQAVARQYVQQKDPKRGEPWLRRYIAFSPEMWAYVGLADLRLADGDEAGYVAALEEALQQPDEGLGGARVQKKLAEHYMTKNDFENARIYALGAAETGARWAMETAHECEEKRG
ncbi:MAG: tetratricopeptide repeat protein, partial [Planctomycetia bacterium]